MFLSESSVRRMSEWDGARLRRSLAAKKAIEARWNKVKELPEKCDCNTNVLPSNYGVIQGKEKKEYIYIKEINKENPPRSPKGEVDLSSLKEKFEIFRKQYPGSKRGLDTEFNEFVKKYKGHVGEIVPVLLPALEKLIAWREQAVKRGEFVPSFANLKTWLNQRRWETEFPGVESLNTSENERTSVKFD